MHLPLAKGSRVVIASGPYTGQRATIARIAYDRAGSPASRLGGKRYRVALLDLDGGGIVTLPTSILQPAPQQRGE